MRSKKERPEYSGRLCAGYNIFKQQALDLYCNKETCAFTQQAMLWLEKALSFPVIAAPHEGRWGI